MRLAHPGHQEHLVVHREAEHHADQEDRHEADDRLALHRARSAPSWKTATVAPRVASTESRKPRVAVSGTRIERNTSISSRNASPTTTREVDRQRVAEPLGHVGGDRGQPGDAGRGAGLGLDAGLPVAQRVSRSSVAGVVRAGLRRDQDLRAGAGLVRADDLGVGDVVLAGGPRRDLAERRAAVVVVGDVAAVDDDQQRALATRAERVGHQVGGLALGGVARRPVLSLGKRQVQALQRDGQRAERRRRPADQTATGAPADEPGPADAVVEDRGRRRPALGSLAADPAAERLGLEQAEDGRAAGSARPARRSRPWRRRPGPSRSGTGSRRPASAASAMSTVRPAKTTAEPAVPTATPTASSRSSVCCSSVR